MTGAGAHRARLWAVAVTIAVLAVGAAPAVATAVTFGADLSQPPIDNPQAVCGGFGPSSCLAFATVPSSYAPQSGTVTAVRVRTGPFAQGPMQVDILRSYYQNNLASPGHPNYFCCFLQAYGPVFTPTANAVTTVPADLPVIEQPIPPAADGNTVAAGDFIALAVLGPATRIPVSQTAGALTSYYAPAPQAATTAAPSSNGLPGGQGSVSGYQVLLNADLAPLGSGGGTPGGGTPGGGTGGVAPAALRLPRTAPVAHNRAAVPLVCRLSTACRGTLTLQLPAGRAVDAARRAPTSLGSARFAISAGKRRSVAVALTAAGRKQVKAHRRVRVQAVTKVGRSTQTVVLTLTR